VVVVVDGSRDGFIELLEDLSGRADVILILDDDEIADSGLAGGHAAHHVGPERKVVVGYTPIALPPRRSAGAFATFRAA